MLARGLLIGDQETWGIDDTMARTATSRRRPWLPSGLLAVVLAGGGLCVLPTCGDRPASTAASRGPSTVPSILRIEENGLRYTYHVVSGTEALFDTHADPRALKNLAPDRPEDARRLRARLEEQLEVESLEDLRATQRETIRELESLGYL
jgi:hypothetical protein